LQVEYNSSAGGPRDFLRAAQELGYEAEVYTDTLSDGMKERHRESKYWWRKFLTTLPFSVPVRVLFLECLPSTVCSQTIMFVALDNLLSGL
jgi:hypothetical protein